MTLFRIAHFEQNATDDEAHATGISPAHRRDRL